MHLPVLTTVLWRNEAANSSSTSIAYIVLGVHSKHAVQSMRCKENAQVHQSEVRFNKWPHNKSFAPTHVHL